MTQHAADAFAHLQNLRNLSGHRDTVGLTDDVIQSFLSSDSTLGMAITEAVARRNHLKDEFGNDLLNLSESDLVKELQSDYINFYAPATVNPYVALAARGPWIITAHGAVLHDNGGYGMLGSGHGPSTIISAMSQNWVMANVMTPSYSHKRLAERLERELGHTRGFCPFTKFICMNSGSESVTVSLRIADVNARTHTGPGGKHEGKEIKLMAVEKAFHGRTDRPAQISHSCMTAYDKNLATFRNRDNLILVPANNVAALEAAYAKAEADGYFIELMAIEPVQGEGGIRPVPKGYLASIRALCDEHDILLMFDEVQSGVGQGCLSIIDYDGFQDAECPDLETWSKALNAGQYPLSVLGLNQRASENYVVGIYGNTMTTNPRALRNCMCSARPNHSRITCKHS